MSATRTTHAVVSLAALDVRRRPDHRSELGSQLLMGEVVRALAVSRDRQWWRVENETDGYRGWVRTWGLIPAPAARAARWRRKAVARVVRPCVGAAASPRAQTQVSPLFLNSRLIPGGSRAGFRQVELPDGRRAWVPGKALETGRRRSADLMARVRSLLGAPYLWGGEPRSVSTARDSRSRCSWNMGSSCRATLAGSSARRDPCDRAKCHGSGIWCSSGPRKASRHTSGWCSAAGISPMRVAA